MSVTDLMPVTVTQGVDIESVKMGLKTLIGAPLFSGGEASAEAGAEAGQGLALDSVEALEIVVGIEEKWGVVIEDDSVANEFYSIDTLSGLVKRLLDTPVVEAVSA